MSPALPAEQSIVSVPGAELALRRWSINPGSDPGADPGAPAAAAGAPAAASAAAAGYASAHDPATADPATDRPALICLHETGATAASWQPLADQLATAGVEVDLIAIDRRGWGRSSAPEPYTRTTVAEQSQDAFLVLESLGITQALVCGTGLGAVAAIDLALREPSHISGAIAIEPPLLALAEGATEGLSTDAEKLRKAFEEDGRGAATELFLAGELPYLAPGSERLTAREHPGGGDGQEVIRHPGTLFAELGAVPAWSLPFEALAEVQSPIVLVTGEETPAPVRAATAALAGFAPTSEQLFTQADPLLGPDLARHLPLLANR